MTTSMEQFSLVIGGPFHALLSRLRLLGADGLPTLRAAIILVLIAWLPPALLSVVDYLYNGSERALSYFSDYTAYIRFWLAIGVMVMTERSAHFRLTPVVNQFFHARLICEESMERFRAAVKKADDRSSSAIAELVLLLMLYLAAIFTAKFDLELGGFDWDGRIVEGNAEYSMAGLWSHWISKPLFLFLLLRWCWRFAVWGWLLFQVSRMRLQLVAYHPDRSGGLGFLCVYPMVFSGLIFAVSSVVAAQLVSEIYNAGISRELLQPLILAWIVFVLLIFIGPLAVFVRPLYQLREQAMFGLGRIASEHQAAFQKKWMASQAAGGDLLGSADVSSASDLAPIAASPYSMRVLPVTLTAVIYLALTAGAPMLAVLATQMPLSEFLDFLASTIL